MDLPTLLMILFLTPPVLLVGFALLLIARIFIWTPLTERPAPFEQATPGRAARVVYKPEPRPPLLPSSLLEPMTEWITSASVRTRGDASKAR